MYPSMSKDTVMTMVLAAIQADGKELKDLSQSEIQGYISLAVNDLKLCDDIINRRK